MTRAFLRKKTSEKKMTRAFLLGKETRTSSVVMRGKLRKMAFKSFINIAKLC